MSIERIHPDALFQFDGMAQVVAAVGHKTLYISGQTAMDLSLIHISEPTRPY